MEKRKVKILFIGHEASLSGAPVLLLNLLLLLREETGIRISLAIVREGPFLKEYQKCFDVIVLKGRNYSGAKHVYERAVNIIRNRYQLFRLLIKAAQSDYVFSNTIVNGKVLKTLSVVNNRIITYVHELANVIAMYETSDVAKISLKRTQVFAYPSEAVKQVLLEKYCIKKEKLHKLDYYFPANHVAGNNKEKEEWITAFKQKYGINNTDFLIVGMGYASKRKGIDLFLDTCEYIAARQANIKFFWIGGFDSAEMEVYVRRRVNDKLAKNVFFTGSLPHSYYNLAPFDLFFLSSREDPYPLVVLEAALMKIPAICFQPSGGIVDFVENNGYLIPDFSIEKAGDEIIKIAADIPALKYTGELAFQKVMNLHVNKERIIQQFLTLLQ